MHITWLLGRPLEMSPSTAFTVVHETRAASAKPREVQVRADRVEIIMEHGFSDLVQASAFSTTTILPGTHASKVLKGASSATQAWCSNISRMSIAEKVTTTVRAGIAIAAKDASGVLGVFLKNTKNDPNLFSGVVIIAGDRRCG